MKQDLEKAFLLRSEGKYKESNAILVKLVNQYPIDPIINYQCAWSFDLLGSEAEAVPYYEKAISLGLEGEEVEGALVGLGSSFGTLGEYEKSKRTFLVGIDLFPDNKAMKVFYSMTLFNLKEHNKAMEILLKCIAKTSSDTEIVKYKKAIAFYSDKLDSIWE